MSVDIESFVGMEATYTRTVSESDVYLFAGITGNNSDIHMNHEFMKHSVFKQRIAHGALLVGFMATAASMVKVGKNAAVGYDKIRFTAPVFFGDTITTRYVCTHAEHDRRRLYAECKCTNQNGVVVGVATHIRAIVD